MPESMQKDRVLSFYEDMKHGWWWYEVQVDKDQKQVKKSYVPSLKDYSREELWNMHPDDFHALITAFQKKAVQAPTEENVHEFYTMVDIMRRRAQAFQNVAEVVWMKNPELILGRDYPASRLGDNTRNRIRYEEIEAKIATSAEDFGFVYFYSETCEFCQAQNGVVKYFSDKYHWPIKKVEINREPEFAAQFHVETVPFILLVYKNTGSSLPVAVGVVAIDELEKNIYRGIRLLAGDIKPEEFNMYDYERGGVFDPDARIK